MKIPRIFTSMSLPDSRSEKQSQFELTGATVNYIVRVLRMNKGEKLYLFDGSGGQWLAQITAISKSSVHTHLLGFSPVNRESPLTVHLGQCISRGERMDYAIRKAVEMGVTEITPLFSERCEVKLNSERQQKKNQHWEKLVISACEQCERNLLPRINPPCTIDSWVRSRNERLKLVLHHHSKHSLATQVQPDAVALLVGPEGGLSDSEVMMAEKYDFSPVALGSRVLRTETAPVAAIAVLQYLWGDWND